MTIIISLNVTCSRHDIAEKLLNLALNNNHFDFFDDCSFKTCFQVWIYTVSVVGTLIILAILTFIGLFIYWRKKMSGFMMIFDRKVNTKSYSSLCIIRSATSNSCPSVCQQLLV
jgi:hypothetical protein